MYQSTIAKQIELRGIGLHTGNEIKIKLSPAPANSGILFITHTNKGNFTLSPTPNAVQTTELATTLNMGRSSLSTVEHLLATFNGMQIDNIEVHVYSNSSVNEIPILDGSAQDFVHAIKKVGKKNLPHERKIAFITKPFSFVENNKSITTRPYDGLYIDYTIDFPHHCIGKQRFVIEITPETFTEVASARTFGFLKEVEYLHSKGLALGGSLANAIVLDDEGVVNPSGLRYKDEFVRHKVLDFIGDIAMLGLPLHGAFEVKYSGHRHNNLFLHALSEANAFEVSTKLKKSYASTQRFFNKPASIICNPL